MFLILERFYKKIIEYRDWALYHVQKQAVVIPFETKRSLYCNLNNKCYDRIPTINRIPFDVGEI